ncbi:MAG: prefoldin subunit beta [Methanosarcinaceae archaeon]|nr:prefoldin subunit beta [Methanosarcinaceae archaeon]MCL7410984.1 prefoldin subunit beta [Methanosarcinaceae archaeon]MDF1534441.1 prefoldin subunit beta [Methanosarcinaceae archaeon]
MSNELPPQIQNQLAQLQQVQQQAQALAAQKGQMDSIKKESEMALEELGQLPDDAIIYRAVGELQIQSSKEETIAKLNEKNETLTLRLQSISKQEERIAKRFTQLQEQLEQSMGTQAQ